MIAKVYLTSNIQERSETAKYTYVELFTKIIGEKTTYFAEPIYDIPEKVDKYLEAENVSILGYFKIYERDA